MQQVLSYSDYMKLKNEGRMKNPPKINAEIKEEKRNEVSAEKSEYVMAHPDRHDSFLRGTGKYLLDGEELQITNGILVVTEKQKTKLVEQGFIFLYKKETGANNE